MSGEEPSLASSTAPLKATASAHVRPRHEGSSRMTVHRSQTLHCALDGAVRSTLHVQPLQPDDASHPNAFLLQLQREKRRAERSATPLSISVFRMDAGAAHDLDRLLEILHAAKRQTDILGHLPDERLAVLCPDTGEDGLMEFLRKIDARATDLPFTAVGATYPDHLFDSLSDASHRHPELPAPFLADTPGSRTNGYALKRAFDIVGSIVAIFAFIPVMLAVAIAIASTSRGPVIFRQLRLGKGAFPFAFYKFRSMRIHSDDSIHRAFVARLIKRTPAALGTDAGCQAAGVYKLKEDPRVTRIGRFIRKTSIDELPQFFNVLKGEMSLVGPRPPIPYEVESYQAWHLRRVLSVKPGITGLWQVEGRSKVDFDEMVRMDLRYVRECSLMVDLKILAKTVLVVLRCDGAD